MSIKVIHWIQCFVQFMLTGDRKQKGFYLFPPVNAARLTLLGRVCQKPTLNSLIEYRTDRANFCGNISVGVGVFSLDLIKSISSQAIFKLNVLTIETPSHLGWGFLFASPTVKGGQRRPDINRSNESFQLTRQSFLITPPFSSFSHLAETRGVILNCLNLGGEN